MRRGGFGLPALGRQLRTARGADRAGRIGSGHGMVLLGGGSTGRCTLINRKCDACLEDAEQGSLQRPSRQLVVLGRPIGLVRRVDRLGEIATHGDLHLDRVDAVVWLAVLPRNVPAAKPTIRHLAEGRRLDGRLDCGREAEVARPAIIRADTYVRQLAVEQARDHRPDRMTVVQNDARIDAPEPTDLGGKRGMVRVEPRRPGGSRSRSAVGSRAERDRAARRRTWWSGIARSSPGRGTARPRMGRGSRR